MTQARIITAISATSLVLLLNSHAFAADSPDYGREVRPILSQFCFKCHGPDKLQRQADLRLDTREGATTPASSGESAIVPTEPAASELIRRIHAADPDERMPPASTKMQLSDAQMETLRRWIAAGAEYKAHWSFVPPKRPAVPLVQHRDWPRGAIDSFVLAKLESEKLAPSPEADRYTLVRRASLDLIGLPPTPEEADEFVHDPSPDAYEKLIDRLLASPHYGERWARRWLDLARYADTNGYEKDRTRSIWPYRDWVINSLNTNMPFDQFTIEQLAGDMLPNATNDQKIATGFHRNTMLNEEGGIDPLEFRFYAMTDRVATTATVWLGLTLGCAQCHTHKYDPITHTDYYSFFALLNNADEPEIDVERPDIAARRAELQQRITAMEADLPNRFPPPDEFEWTPIQPTAAKSANGAKLDILDDASVFVSGPTPDTDTYELQLETDLNDVVAIRLEALSDPKLPSKGPGRTPHGNFVLSEITATIAPRDGGTELQPVKFARATADFSQDTFTPDKAIDGNTKSGGWAIHGPGEWNVNRTATFLLDKPTAPSDKPMRWTIRLEQQFGKQHTIGKFRLSLGRRNRSSRGTESEQRLAHLIQKFGDWLKREQELAVKWTRLKPVSATSNLPLLTIQEDDSIFASGDMSKRDVYEISFAAAQVATNAALPVPSPPSSGETVGVRGPNGDNATNLKQTGSNPPTKRPNAESPTESSPPHPNPLPPKSRGEGIGKETQTTGWTAIRIEALPDDRLPKDGPGRVYYEGPFGDFFLSEVSLKANGQPVKLTNASHSFANGGNTAATALDGNQQTGWSINGGQGKPHVAVFRFEKPVDRTSQFDLTLLFERYYAAGLGLFRVSVTDDPRPVEASAFPMDLEPLLLATRESRAESKESEVASASSLIAHQPSLVRYFCEVAPELSAERQAITNLKQQLPAFPTSLAFQERPANNPRLTHRYHRGEFLQPKELVEPAMLSALPPLPKDRPANRLTFARWLVSRDNPLAARVTVNREWSAFFGKGFVRTVEDFGSQGASPTHPALMDWLAVEMREGVFGVQFSVFSKDKQPARDSVLPEHRTLKTENSPQSGWDMKRLHRLIATSATYRQSSRVSPELLAKDAQNEWLARGPRFRLEGELVRDAALHASGLLSEKLLGPSVFPPQPASITTEGTYGGLAWNVSPGEDHYRRTMYTFCKRTAPFAMGTTFDAPSGEACIARREVTNTPLQALTLLNDTVFVETAQALGREFAARDGSVDQRLTLLFRRCLTRPPAAAELSLLKQFMESQRARLESKQLDAKTIAGQGTGNDVERAAWTLLARAVLNLDEAFTKN